MMEIKVGEYVRTKRGYIDKVDALYGMKENTIHLENQKWFDTNNIAKHHKRIINLIEVNDIVNKKCVEHIYYYDNYIEVIFINDIDLYRLKEKDIKTILTHEQYEQNAYRLEVK